ncbi:MAG TPA: triphosphoribosyl-dephospho-CoA synthase, partial [Steroidobacteraceae bacterium]|nr:triphosphoribosyl-dephospho-CoA synthase [Steroidobacteraceae bacterium]
HTWPKPGLVTAVDNGSHRDMDAALFRASISVITPYLGLLAHAGADNAPFLQLQHIGVEAERAMLAATQGVNTHRGAIFALGLLCAAAGRRLAGLHGRQSLGRIVRKTWGRQIRAAVRVADSHGERVRRLYGIGGARTEAAAGFPAAYRVGLPALIAARRLATPERARVQALFSLLAVVQDTNLLFRGGPAALQWARAAAREFLSRGGVGRPGWQREALAIHRLFVQRGLSPGGTADMLAVTLLLERLES